VLEKDKEKEIEKSLDVMQYNCIMIDELRALLGKYAY